MAKVRPLFQYCGAKSEMLDWLYAHEPRESVTCAVEPFCGTAVWTLGSPNFPVEVINDLDLRIANFFDVLKVKPRRMCEMVAATPYSRDEWERAGRRIEVWKESGCPRPDGDAAWAFLVRLRMSMGTSAGKVFSRVVNHSRRDMASSCSRWLPIPDEIARVADRLKTVQIEGLNHLDCIAKYDGPGTLLRCDPPYLLPGGNAGPNKLYGVPFTIGDHKRLLAALLRAKAKVVLCGYAHPLYDANLTPARGWERFDREVPCRSAVTSSGKVAERKTRTEVLWVRRERRPVKEPR